MWVVKGKEVCFPTNWNGFQTFFFALVNGRLVDGNTREIRKKEICFLVGH